MKTKRLLNAVAFGGGIALLSNPVWAGGSYGSNKNHAHHGMSSESGAQVSGVDEQQTKKVEQALKEKGFEPGRVDGVIDSQTQIALLEFQRDHNLPATGIVDGQTAEQLGIIVEVSPVPSGESLPQQGSSSSDNMPSPIPAE